MNTERHSQSGQKEAHATATPPDSERLNRLSAEFRRSVSLARAAEFAERLWPRVLPPVLTGGLFLSASWFGLWTALPVYGRISGMAAFAAVAVASPLLFKTKSLFVTRDDALRRLDTRDGGRHAQTLADAPASDSPPQAQAIWRQHLKQIWEARDWRGFEVGRPRSDVPARDPHNLRYAVALAALLGAGYAAPDLRGPVAAGFDWTRPAPVVPPLEIRAWITPPDNLGLSIVTYQTAWPAAAQDGRVAAHQGSTLTLLVYGENAVRVNGADVPAGRRMESRGATGARNRVAYQYEIPMTVDLSAIEITGGPSWRFAVTPDLPPSATIGTLAPTEQDPNTLQLDHTETDDFGVRNSQLRIVPPATTEGATPLPSARIAPITLGR